MCLSITSVLIKWNFMSGPVNFKSNTEQTMDSEVRGLLATRCVTFHKTKGFP